MFSKKRQISGRYDYYIKRKNNSQYYFEKVKYNTNLYTGDKLKVNNKDYNIVIYEDKSLHQAHRPKRPFRKYYYNTPTNLIGIATLTTNPKKNINIYSDNLNDYYIKVKGIYGNVYFKTIITNRRLYTDDKINIFGNFYTLKINKPEEQVIHNNLDAPTMYNKFPTYGNFSFHQHYSIPPEKVKIGIVQDKNNHNKFHSLFKKTGSFGKKWKFYVKKNGILMEIKHLKNKFLHEGDTVIVPNTNQNFIFKEFDD